MGTPHFEYKENLVGKREIWNAEIETVLSYSPVGNKILALRPGETLRDYVGQMQEIVNQSAYFTLYAAESATIPPFSSKMINLRQDWALPDKLCGITTTPPTLTACKVNVALVSISTNTSLLNVRITNTGQLAFSIEVGQGVAILSLLPYVTPADLSTFSAGRNIEYA